MGDIIDTTIIVSDEDLNDLVKDNIVADEDNMTLSSSATDFTLSLRIEDFDDIKEMKKFIKCIERQIRGSVEYRLWLAYLKEVVGDTKCLVTNEDNNEVTIEVHHHPFSLYNIVATELNKMIASGTKFCTFDLATRIIEMHFKNKIGYVPLVTSIHEKFHNGHINIPMELVHGNYDYLVQNNLTFLDEDEQKVIKSRLSITKRNCGWDEYKWSNPKVKT